MTTVSPPRAGRRVWTSVRREQQLTAAIRAALGEPRFEELFDAASQLDERAAVAAARADGSADPHSAPSALRARGAGK